MAIADDGDGDGEMENIVIFPFMAQGHIIPFLALSLHIQNRYPNYIVHIVNTPLNIKKLRSSLPPDSANIRLLEIPFESTDHPGLPAGAENTDVLPYHLVLLLLEATLSLRPAFRDLVKGLTDEKGKRPLCVIADIFFGWTADVAAELGVFHAVFSGASGYGLACYYSVWRNLPHRKVDSDEFDLPDFPEAAKIHRSQLPVNILEADGTDAWSRFQERNLLAWENSGGVLFNTVEEFDSIGFVYFRRKLRRPVWAVGPILLSAERRATVSTTQPGSDPDRCINWLASKPPNSVLYVSFGSMNTIPAAHMMELAIALEATGRDFIWVVRPPMGVDINSEFDGGRWLPEEFERRMEASGKGLLVRKWAPQVEILGHGAVAAFLTHCGWNSTLEALTHGVPLIGWPMAAEQFFNVKLLEEIVGVCVEAARGKRCEVRSEVLKEKIELVMAETSERGKSIRKRAAEVREMIRDAMKDDAAGSGCRGASVTAMDDFFNTVVAAREKTAVGRNGTASPSCHP